MRRIAFTKQGLEEVKTKYDSLTKLRVDAVKQLQIAREMGDLSENAAYKVARSKLSSIDSRLRRLQLVIRSAYVADITFNGTVDIGCFVTISDNNSIQTFQIVGSYESDVINKKISIFSPVGKALIGKREKDTVQIHTPSGKINYEVMKVCQSLIK